MDEILGIFGFSLGATLGAGLVRTVGGGLRPMLRQGFKAGIAVGDVLGRARDGIAASAAEARANLDDVHAEARAERGARRGPARKIEIVQD